MYINYSAFKAPNHLGTEAVFRFVRGPDSMGAGNGVFMGGGSRDTGSLQTLSSDPYFGVLCFSKKKKRMKNTKNTKY